MQDSIEDYIKLAHNVNENSAATIKNEKEKQLFSDVRALKIVEFAIDGQLRPEVFIKCLNYIDPSFYQDIVEERHLIRNCGYPICGNKTAASPKKQYFISNKANKVYDITERKNFCSNFCYKASNHIKNQIDSSPLRHRTDKGCPDLKLLLATESGIPGEEVVGAKNDDATFTSVSDFAEASLGDAEKFELSAEFKRLVIEKNRKDEEDKLTASKAMHQSRRKDYPTKKTLNANAKERAALVKEVETEVVESCKNLDKSLQLALEKVKRIRKERVAKKSMFIETTKNPELVKQEEEPSFREKPSTSRQPDLQVTHASSLSDPKRDSNAADHLDRAYRCFTEWATLDTYILLQGDTYIHGVLNERKLTDLFDRLHVSDMSTSQRVRYRDICRRLSLQDVNEACRDSDLLLGGGRLNPLPEYERLKSESKDLTIKVKAFLGGVAYDTGSNANNKALNMKTEAKLTESTSETEEFSPEEIPAVLPLGDNSNHNAIRRRIFLNAVNPYVRKHASELKLDESILAQVQDLVYTFKLCSNNIVFKPVIWKLIALALIEVSSIRNDMVHKSLQTDLYGRYIMSEFPHSLDITEFISRVRYYLEHVEVFIETYVSSTV